MQQYPDTGLPPQGGQGMQFAQTADADQNLQQQGTQFPQDADTLASAYTTKYKRQFFLFAEATTYAMMMVILYMPR